jgi:hypothetical protein
LQNRKRRSRVRLELFLPKGVVFVANVQEAPILSRIQRAVRAVSLAPTRWPARHGATFAVLEPTRTQIKIAVQIVLLELIRSVAFPHARLVVQELIQA